MKYVQTYKLMKNLNALIKAGEISKPVEKEQIFFDVKYLSLTAECAQYNLTIKAIRKNSSVYGEFYTVYFNDPNHKLLDKKVSTDAIFTEEGTKLTQLVFNRLARYRKRSK